ncbi:MAG TPA: mitofilin family membrane protein [Stellaceae bacterium]|nr:mitofilin family membrane protein [Stellaceae bacterium]
MSEQRGEAEPTGASANGDPTVIDVTPTPGPEPQPERAAVVPPKSRGRQIPITALVVLVLAVGTSPYWALPIASILPWGGTPENKPPAVDTAAIDATLSALAARIGDLAQAQQKSAALEPRVAQLEQLPAPAPNPQNAQQAAQQAQVLTALGERMGALEQRITTLAAAQSSQSAADATKALQAQIQALTQKLDEQSQLLATLQSQKSAGGDRTDAALVVTVSQLRAVLATSRPYAPELQAAEALAKDQPDLLKQLQAFDARADRGIPDIGSLRERFGAVAVEVDRVAAPASGGGWRDRLVAGTKRFFHVRQVAEGGQGDAGDPEAILATAETSLKRSDLAGAVAALRRLQGAAADVAKPWLDDAQARFDADQAVASLSATLARTVLAAPAGAKP